MQKDYWIYQKRPMRENEVPWALYIVKDYERNNPEKTSLSFTFYSENINTVTHSKFCGMMHYPKVKDYVETLTVFMIEFSTVDALDTDQLEESILDILLH